MPLLSLLSWHIFLVNNLSLSCALTLLVPRHPGKFNFWLSHFEMIHEWDLCVQSKLSRWEQTLLRLFLVISLMNPQALNRYKRGVCVGSARHIHTKPDSHSRHVHRAGVSGMGGTQKLQNDVERTRMAKNLQHSRKDTARRKKPLHKCWRRRRTLWNAARTVLTKQQTITKNNQSSHVHASYLEPNRIQIEVHCWKQPFFRIFLHSTIDQEKFTNTLEANMFC